MDPVIHYAVTSDGVNIAVSTMGEGPTVVFLPVLPLSHLQLEWQMPGMREFLEAFGKNHRVIRFDARGLGLSDRSDSDRSFDGHMLDLEAVVEKLKLDRFAIFAASYAGPMGIRYAAEHPDRVSRLMLWSTHAIHREVVERLPAQVNQQRKAVNQLAGADRDLFIRTYLHRAVGWTEGDTANRFVEVAKQTIDPDKFFENLEHHAAFDATEYLPKVTVPVLVMHRPAFIGSNVDVAKSLTARMQDARLSLFEGESVVPFIGDSGAVIRTCLAFLDEDQSPATASSGESAMRTILYTDIEGHSGVMQRLGDVKGRELLREHERLVRAALREHGGEEVRTMGDGFLASFRSTQQAVSCAVALQRATENMEPVDGERPAVRVGINAGEPIDDGEDLYGESVFLASKIAGSARGGEILASVVVRELAAGKGFQFTPHGEVELPGSRESIHVYEVLWHESVPS